MVGYECTLSRFRVQPVKEKGGVVEIQWHESPERQCPYNESMLEKSQKSRKESKCSDSFDKNLHLGSFLASSDNLTATPRSPYYFDHVKYYSN